MSRNAVSTLAKFIVIRSIFLGDQAAILLGNVVYQKRKSNILPRLEVGKTLYWMRLTERAKPILFLLTKLRRRDLNPQPRGYEPPELPLLHPAIHCGI